MTQTDIQKIAAEVAKLLGNQPVTKSTKANGKPREPLATAKQFAQNAAGGVYIIAVKDGCITHQYQQAKLKDTKDCEVWGFKRGDNTPCFGAVYLDMRYLTWDKTPATKPATANGTPVAK